MVWEPISKRQKIPDYIKDLFNCYPGNRIISAFLVAWQDRSEVNFDLRYLSFSEKKILEKISAEANLLTWRYFALETPSWFQADDCPPGIWPIHLFLKHMNFWVAKKVGYLPSKIFPDFYEVLCFSLTEDMINDIQSHPNKWMEAYINMAFEKRLLLSFDLLLKDPPSPYPNISNVPNSPFFMESPNSPGPSGPSGLSESSGLSGSSSSSEYPKFLGIKNWINCIEVNHSQIRAEQLRIHKGLIADWLYKEGPYEQCRFLKKFLTSPKLIRKVLKLVESPVRFTNFRNNDGYPVTKIDTFLTVYFNQALECDMPILEALWWGYPQEKISLQNESQNFSQSVSAQLSNDWVNYYSDFDK